MRWWHVLLILLVTVFILSSASPNRAARYYLMMTGGLNEELTFNGAWAFSPEECKSGEAGRKVVFGALPVAHGNSQIQLEPLRRLSPQYAERLMRDPEAIGRGLTRAPLFTEINAAGTFLYVLDTSDNELLVVGVAEHFWHKKGSATASRVVRLLLSESPLSLTRCLP